MDQMVKHFTCRRATRRWTLSLFMNFLDIAALNSLIIWCQFNEEFNEKHDKRTLFLKQLIKQLIVPHVERRSQNLSGLHFDVINDMRKIISPEFFVSASISQSQSSQLDEPQIDLKFKVNHIIERFSVPNINSQCENAKQFKTSDLFKVNFYFLC